MKIKNINAFEMHVEKAVVVLAVLFLGWMCYRDLIQDPDSAPLPNRMGVNVAPGQVGDVIDNAVQKLQGQVHSALQSADRHVGAIPDYEGAYAASLVTPLPDTLTQMSAIAIGPMNLRIKNVASATETPWVYVVPVAPPLTKVQAQQGRGVAIIPPTTQDVTWVELKAIFPLDVWRKSMAGGTHLKADEAGLPRQYRRTTFYRVQVRRQQRLPSGRWGPWTMVKGTYQQPLPQLDLTNATRGQVAAQLGILEQSQSQILTPAFYTLEVQHHLVAPANQPQAPAMTNLVPGGLPPFQPGVGLQHPTNIPNNGFAPEGVPPGPGNVAPVTTTIPVNFYDGTAIPGETYRYAMRVVMYNPVFSFPYKLTEMAAKAQPWLASTWSKATKPVKIRQSEYFFLDSSQLDGLGRASFRIFKWVHGVWTDVDEWVAPGQGIGNAQPAPLMNPLTGNLENKTVDFATGYTLVAARENASASSLTIVIAKPDGSLGLRNSAWDAKDSQQRRLLSRVNRTGFAPTPAVPGTPVP